MISFFSLVFTASSLNAQLLVEVNPPVVAGKKAVVKLALKNGLAEKIESARAAVFLLDEKGQVVGQGTRWIIGGDQDKRALAVGATNQFSFVISGETTLTKTNLSARVQLNRLVLAGGKLADVKDNVVIKASEK